MEIPPNPVLAQAHPLVLMLMGFSVTAVGAVVVAALVWRRRWRIISYWDGKVQRGVPLAPSASKWDGAPPDRGGP